MPIRVFEGMVVGMAGMDMGGVVGVAGGEGNTVIMVTMEGRGGGAGMG